MHSIRFSTLTASGEFVIVQFEHDPELVYISREQIASPGAPAVVTIGTNTFKAEWDPNSWGRQSPRKPMHEFLVGKSIPNSSVAHETIPTARNLVHHYTMSAPGNATPGGDAGTWGVLLSDKRITLVETVQNVVNRQALSAWLTLKPCGRSQAPTGHMLYTRLAMLGLVPTSSESYQADVKIDFS